MFRRLSALAIASVLLATLSLAAQTPSPPPPLDPPDLPPPPATAVAANVNGQPIPEMAVYRGMMREKVRDVEAARKEILNYLVDNMLIDQYLQQLKIQADPKDVSDRLQQIKEEAKKQGQDFPKMLAQLRLSEEDLNRELVSALRWDKFATQQATDKALRDMFDKNASMFDGSMVQARHILLPPSAKDENKQKLAGIKAQIEKETAQEVAKLPPTLDAASREKERAKILDQAFAKAAASYSTCPSKAAGGDLGWFPRTGMMVEPFARVAFALKPYQMSDTVTTDFGYHLIMATDTKPGHQVKFEDVRPMVLEAYAERLREAVVQAYKPRSQIVINPLKK